MSGQLTIRRATEKDAPYIFSIIQKAFKEYSKITGQTNLEALEETVEDIAEAIQSKTVFIAVMDNNIMGTVRLSIDGDEAYLSRFAVDCDSQNAGIGKSLMNEVDSYLKKIHVKKVTLHTSSKHDVLMRFYYGIGFYVEAIETDRGYLRARMVKEY